MTLYTGYFETMSPSTVFVSYLQTDIAITMILCVFIVFVLLLSIGILAILLTPFKKKYIEDNFFASQETKRNIEITRRLRANVGPYKPPLWYNAHLGTCLPWGENPDMEYDREIFKGLSEDNRVAEFVVDWFPRRPLEEERAHVCLFFPGLGLSSENKFAKKFVQTVAQDIKGYLCGIVNPRGIGIPLQSSKLWHPGYYFDGKVVLSRYSECIFYLVGFSAGSNLVLKLLLDAELCKKNHIKAALGVCINKDYLTARTDLEASLVGKLYSMLITAQHKQIMKKNKHIHQFVSSETLSKIFGTMTVSEYDKLASTTLYGFKDENHYAMDLSACSNAAAIGVPFLIIQPRDDPLHNGKVREHVAVNDLSSNPHIVYFEPCYGNHFGFYEGSIFEALSNKTSYTYPAKCAVEFFDTVRDSLGPA